MATPATQSFCEIAREAEVLRNERQEETRAARQAKKASEQLLLEALGSCPRHFVSVDAELYVVEARVRNSFPSFTSAVVSRLPSLWDDPEALRARLEATGRAETQEALVDVLLEYAGGAPVRRPFLHLAPARGQEREEEAVHLRPEHAELAAALVRARAALEEGKLAYLDQAKQLQQRRGAAEAALVEEMAPLSPGRVRRVCMQDARGAPASFYLRLKPPHRPPKKKITVRALRKHFASKLALLLSASETATRDLHDVCLPSFRDAFLADLLPQLQSYEGTPASASRGERRVALDRVPAPRTGA